MKGLKALTAECCNHSLYKITVTFYKEDDERNFLQDVAETLRGKYVVSTLIHDLDVCIELYKKYFPSSDYLVVEDDPTQPILFCSPLNSEAASAVIDNFGYYILDAYLYWTEEKITPHDMSLYSKDGFFINCSLLTIRQVLDLSLEMQAGEQIITILWDVLKRQLIFN